MSFYELLTQALFHSSSFPQAFLDLVDLFILKEKKINKLMCLLTYFFSVLRFSRKITSELSEMIDESLN